ncbi:MAG TPA: hypothetical protein VIV35_11885 [Chitinophagaceae bacterium]
MKVPITYLFAFVCVIIIACNHKQSPQQTNSGSTNNSNVNTDNNNDPAVKDSLLFSNWYVKGCAERAAKGDTKFPQSGDDFPDLMYPLDNYIRTNGDSIVYNRYEEHLCCREVRVATQRQGNMITINEYWFRKGCKCKCSSMVHAVIYDLPKGEYQVYAVATGTDPFDDKPTNGRDTVMNKKIFIR